MYKPCKSWDKLPFPQLVSRISEPSSQYHKNLCVSYFQVFRVVVFEIEIAFNAVLSKKIGPPGIVVPKDRIVPLRIAWRCDANFRDM